MRGQVLGVRGLVIGERFGGRMGERLHKRSLSLDERLHESLGDRLVEQ